MTDKNEKNGQFKKVLKKGAGISLCAVLAGGLAAGAFEGVNYLTGWNQTNVQAAVNANDSVALMKAEKTVDSEEKTRTKGSLDVSDIVEKAMPSVVSISTKSVQEVQDYFGIFSQYGYAPMPEEREVEGSGSGIIIGKNDTELLVVTNYHVVQGANNLSVSFIDNEAYEAKVKGYNAEKDLAVVAVPLDDITDDTLGEIDIATVGSSDDLKVGEQVIAIGNALGYGQSVTTGIVSAKNRRANSDYSQNAPGTEDDNEDGINLIQTDAAINPGNSGGALINMDGEVIGINSAKLAATQVEGIGYAIAISDVTENLEELMNQVTRDRVEDGNHGVLGITGSTVSKEAHEVYGVPNGVVVVDVTEGGAADKAGIKEKSIITKFDGRSVTGIDQLVDMLSYYEAGEEVEVIVQAPHGNDGYKEKTVTLKLGENPDKEKEDKDDSEKDKDDESRDRESIFKDWEERGNIFGRDFEDGEDILEDEPIEEDEWQ